MNNIEKQLRTLRSIAADEAFHVRLQAMAGDLPDLRPRSVVPLVAFRLALAGITLLLLGSLGTGVLLAAKGSNPGSVLYPLKQVVDTHHVPFFSTPAASPTAVPTSTPQEVRHAIQAPYEQENEQEGLVSSQSAPNAGNESVHGDVKGISVHGGDEEKVQQSSQQPANAPSILQEVPPSLKSHTSEESDN